MEKFNNFLLTKEYDALLEDTAEFIIVNNLDLISENVFSDIVNAAKGAWQGAKSGWGASTQPMVPGASQINTSQVGNAPAQAAPATTSITLNQRAQAAKKSIDDLINAQIQFGAENPSLKGVMANKIKELRHVSSYLKRGMRGELSDKFFDPWKIAAAERMQGYGFGRDRQRTQNPEKQKQEIIPSLTTKDEVGEINKAQGIGGNQTTNASNQQVQGQQPQQSQEPVPSYSTSVDTFSNIQQPISNMTQGTPTTASPNYGTSSIDTFYQKPRIRVKSPMQGPSGQNSFTMQPRENVKYMESFYDWCNKINSRKLPE